MADNATFDNGLGTARVISFSSNRQVFQNTAGDLSYSVDRNDANDYYKVTLNRSASLVVSITGMTNNADLELLNSAGNVEKFSKNTGNVADAVTTGTLAAGTYYIRVHNDADRSVSTNYTLTVDTIIPNRTDLLWRNTTGSYIYVYTMDGNQFVRAQTAGPTLGGEWALDCAGDLTGDGKEDYLFRSQIDSRSILWQMDGTTFVRAFTLYTQPGFVNAGIADFTGDGKADILLRNQTTGVNYIQEMNGTQLVRKIFLDPETNRNWVIETTADYDLDGKTDIIWRNTSTGDNRIWYMDVAAGGPTVTRVGALPRESDSSARIGGIGDFNGDGKQDIYWRFYKTSSFNRVWYMDGETLVTTDSSLNGIVPTSTTWLLPEVLTQTRPADLAGNTAATAFNIGTIISTVTYKDSINGINDSEDFYKFSLQSGSQLTFSLTGLAGQTDFQLILDANKNGVIDTTETPLFSDSSTGGAYSSSARTLAVGDYFIRVRSTIPQTSNYELGISTQAAELVDLSFVSNFDLRDGKSTSNPAPIVTGVNLDPTGNTPLRLTYSVRNTGNIAQTFTPNFYISRDTIITPGADEELTIAENAQITIAANATVTRTVTLRLPFANAGWWGNDQTYNIGMVLDKDNQIPEFNESNNTRTAPIGITGILRPDLLGQSIILSTTSGSPGSGLNIRGSIRNQGNAATDAGETFVINFVLSKDNIFNFDGEDYVLTGRLVSKEIAAKTTVSFNTTTTDRTAPIYFDRGPLVLPTSGTGLATDWNGWVGNGTYYIGMFIDRIGDSGESANAQLNNFGQALTFDYAAITISGLA